MNGESKMIDIAIMGHGVVGSGVAEVLIKNACDPDLDYLEFKPEIREAMEEYNKNHESNGDEQIDME